MRGAVLGAFDMFSLERTHLPRVEELMQIGATHGVLTDVPGCEGLTLDLNALWAEADRLEATSDDDKQP